MRKSSAQRLGVVLLQVPERGPLQRLLRDEGRVLFRFNERWLVRGPHIGPMPVLLR